VISSLSGRLLIAALLLSGPVTVAAEQPAGSRDVVLIIDTSKSMKGAGGYANIFGAVKSTSLDLVKALSDGDTFTLITYDSITRVFPTVVLRDETDRRRVSDVIQSLAAAGNWTYTADALKAGLAEADRLQGLYPGHGKFVAILTDGINDPPPGERAAAPTLAEVTKPYAGKPWYVFQVQLSKKEDLALTEALKSFPNGQTIPGGSAREKLEKAKSIVVTTPPPPLPPPRPVATIKLADKKAYLRIGKVRERAESRVRVRLEPAAPSARLSATIISREQVPVAVALDVSVVANPDGSADLLLGGGVQAEVPDGTYAGLLQVRLDDPQVDSRPVDLPFRVETSVKPAVWPFWAGGLLLALIVLIGAMGASRWRRGRLLDGTLTYGRPGSSPLRIDDLSACGTRVWIGSEQIPLESGVEKVAELSSRDVDGIRHVVVKATPKHELTSANRAESDLVLYDGTKFEVAGWAFQYSGPVPKRPAS
jgi:hypothetical protein